MKVGKPSSSQPRPRGINDCSYLHVLDELTEPLLVKRRKEEDCPCLTMERSLQILLQLKMEVDTKQRQTIFEMVLNVLRDSTPQPNNFQHTDSDVWAETLQVLPHLLSVVKAVDGAQPKLEASLLFAELLIDVGSVERVDRTFSGEAKILLEKAEEILNLRRIPDETRIRGNVLRALGLCSETDGISKRSYGLKVRMRCLEVRQKLFAAISDSRVLELDDRLLYEAEMDLACSLQQYNRMEEIEKICQKCRSKHEDWGPETQFPYECSRYYNHMAYVHLYNADTEEATKAAEKGYRLLLGGGLDVQNVFQYRFDWATIMFQSGERGRAIEEHLAILGSRTEECGEDHVLALQSRLNIGIMYFFVGQPSKAE